MARFGFCSGTYQGQSPNADAERCINLIPEAVESQHGKSAMVLYGRPGLKQFAAAVDTPARGIWSTASRLFAVIGAGFYEFDSAGNPTLRGTVLNDGRPASFAAGQTAVVVAAGGGLYTMNLTTNAFTTIDTTTGAALQGPVVKVGFSDAYFVALIKSNTVFNGTFQLSNLGDPTTWNPLNIFQVEVYPDAPISILVDHREIWVFGPKAIQPYYDSGNFFTPFQPSSGAFIEKGLAAAFSPVKLDNTVFWLGTTGQGGIEAYRAQGYLPQRISNHSVEWFWSRYSTVSDAVGDGYNDGGHAFYVLNFPTANATWVYDVATGLWHERAYWSNGAYQQHLGSYHAECFGKHLVCGPQSGTIYWQDQAFEDDNGNTLRWTRRAPYIATEKERIYHSEFQLDMETGLGQQRVGLRWSDDNAHTWQSERSRDIGAIGKYAQRVRWLRLGQSRGRVYEVSGTGRPRIVDAYVKASPGFSPSERLATQFRKVT